MPFFSNLVSKYKHLCSGKHGYSNPVLEQQLLDYQSERKRVSSKKRETSFIMGSSMTCDATYDEQGELEHIEDVLRTMRKLESSSYRQKLRREQCDECCSIWRQQMIEWMFSVANCCQLQKSVVPTAVYYFDVALSKGLLVSTHEFQAGAMAALYLAFKCHESIICRQGLKFSSFVKLGKGLFEEQDVIDMERKLLHILDWRMHPPTPNCFLRQYLELLPVPVSTNTNTRQKLQELSEAFIEVAIARIEFLDTKSSELGFVALLMAMSRTPDIEKLSRFECQDFLYTIRSIAMMDYKSANVSRCWIKLDILLRTIETTLEKQQQDNSNDVLVIGNTIEDDINNNGCENDGDDDDEEDDGSDRDVITPRDLYSSFCHKGCKGDYTTERESPNFVVS